MDKNKRKIIDKPTGLVCNWCGKTIESGIHCSKECEDKDIQLRCDRAKAGVCVNCGSSELKKGESLCDECKEKVNFLMGNVRKQIDRARENLQKQLKNG